MENTDVPFDTYSSYAVAPGTSDHSKSHTIEWFEKNLITKVPWRYKGAFRRVYPGFLQLTAFMTMNLDKSGAQHSPRQDASPLRWHILRITTGEAP